MKTCSSCQQAKSGADFHGNVAMRDGLQNQCKICHRAAKAAWRAKNKTKIADWSRTYNYGLDPGQFDRMLEAQGGACAICRTTRKLAVDHDHVSGAVRQLLCARCNQMVGYLEGPHVAEALSYIATHRG